MRKIIWLFALLTMLTFSVGGSAQVATNQSGGSAATPAASTSEQPNLLPPPVTAALVAVIPALIVASVGIFAHLLERKKFAASQAEAVRALEEARQAREETAKAQSETEALKNSIIESFEASHVNKIASITLEATLLDLDGHIRTRCNYSNLEITRRGTTLNMFPGEMWLSSGEGRFTKEPSLTKHLHLLPDNNVSPSPVHMTVFKQGDFGRIFTINIVGGLSFGDTLSYEYESEASHGFYICREDVEANAAQTFNKECWSFRVQGMIDKLEIRVNFREGYTPIAYPGVWIGDVIDEKQIDNQELKRVEKGFTHATNWTWAHFEIEKPIVGFSYAIYWVPPEKKHVEAFKNKP